MLALAKGVPSQCVVVVCGQGLHYDRVVYTILWAVRKVATETEAAGASGHGQEGKPLHAIEAVHATEVVDRAF